MSVNPAGFRELRSRPAAFRNLLKSALGEGKKCDREASVLRDKRQWGRIKTVDCRTLQSFANSTFIASIYRRCGRFVSAERANRRTACAAAAYLISPIRGNTIEDTGAGRQKTAIRIGRNAGGVALQDNAVQAAQPLMDERQPK